MLQEEALYKQYLALAIPLGAAAIPVICFKSPTNTPSTQEGKNNFRIRKKNNYNNNPFFSGIGNN